MKNSTFTGICGVVATVVLTLALVFQAHEKIRDLEELVSLNTELAFEVGDLALSNTDNIGTVIDSVGDVAELAIGNSDTIDALADLTILNSELVAGVVYAPDPVLPDFSGTYRLRAVDQLGRAWTGTATPIRSEQVDGLWHVTFLTAGHCIGGPTTVYTIDQGVGKPTMGAAAGGVAHPDLDVGVITFTCFDEIKAREISFAEPAFGDSVFVCGYPLGVGPYLTEGFYTDDGRISASGYPGSSGSAVCNADGEVIGVLVAGYGRQFQFIDFMVLMVPISDFRAWMAGQL